VLNLAVMDGRLIASAGNRLEVLELQGSGLQRVAFFDGQLLITSLSTIKNFVLLGDVHKGLTFVHCINNYRQLVELSKARPTHPPPTSHPSERTFDGLPFCASAGLQQCGR
jgi:hypothetical protein